MESGIFLNILGSFVSTYCSLFPGFISICGILFGSFCQILSLEFIPSSVVSAMSCMILVWTLIFNYEKNERRNYIQAGLVGLGLLMVVLGRGESSGSVVFFPPFDFLFVGVITSLFGLTLYEEKFKVFPGLVGGFTNTLLKMMLFFDDFFVLYVVLVLIFAIIQLLVLTWLLERWGAEEMNSIYVGGLTISCGLMEKVVFSGVINSVWLYLGGMMVIFVGCFLV